MTPYDMDAPVPLAAFYPLVDREHEPEYDTTEVRVLSQQKPIAYLRQCCHANVHPVVSGGETVAHLCIDCDAQLPEWRA